MGGQGQMVYKPDGNEINVPHQFMDSISDIKIKQMGKNPMYVIAVSSWEGKI